MRGRFAVFVVIVGVIAGAQSSAPATANQDVVDELLRMPALAAREDAGAVISETPAPKPNAFSVSGDVPLEVFAKAWVSFSNPGPSDLTPAVRERLLAAAAEYPELLPQLLKKLPENEAAEDRIKAILDKEKDKYNDNWRQAVIQHLMRNSNYFRPELLAAAQKAHDADSWVDGKDDLEALAALDWNQAEPLLLRYRAGKEPRLATLSVALLHKHAAEARDAAAARYRQQLKTIAADRSAVGNARDQAIQALLDTTWEGRDAWHLSMFEDASLRDLKDGYLLMQPLCGGRVSDDPDRWIPVVTRLVSSPKRVVHDMAVTCLIGYQLDTARRDALQPLLPWLMDKNWSSAGDRLRLIQSVDRVELTEAVPGLLAIVEKEDGYDRAYAAQSLAHFRDPRAVAAIKRALETEHDSHFQNLMIQALVKQGVPDDDTVVALEAFAELVQTPEGQEAVERASRTTGESKVPYAAMLGLALAEEGAPSASAIERVITFANQYEKQNPKVAEILRQIAARWPNRTADVELVGRIAEGKSDANAIRAGLARRTSLRQTAGEKLVALAHSSGIAEGIAAVMVGDTAIENQILSGNDTAAIRGLLASARLTREPLPLDSVGALLEKDKQLRTAAEAYLIADDSAAARKLVLAQHPGEALILGMRQHYDPGHYSYEAFDSLEKQLREIVTGSEPNDEVFALLSAGYWGNNGQVILSVRGNRAELRSHSDPARYYYRDFSPDELRQVREFVAQNKIDDLGPLAIAAQDGMQYEYIHVTANGGRRVFMNNPGIGGTGGSVYEHLCKFFRELLDSGPMQLRYQMAGSMPGLEILFHDPQNQVLAVGKEGGELRTLVQGKVARASGVAMISGRTAQVTIESPQRAAPVWVVFDGALGAASTAPTAFPIPRRHDIPKKFEANEGHQTWTWALETPGATYRVGTWKDKAGLWRLVSGKDPVLLLEGNVASPILTPDGNWAAVAKTDSNWAVPNYVVRVDLHSGKSFRVDVPPADNFNPLAFVAGHNKILLMRVRDEKTDDERKPVGPEKPEYRLLDPATGETTVVTGEFGPLSEQGLRPLQPAGQKDLFWATRWNGTDTEIGRYSAAEFTFEKVVKLPIMRLSNTDTWVDEAERKIYIAYHGQLLRVPLP